ncbi:MAG: hypothetical protein JWR08_1499 [Enterovirga sp.]|jgi:chromosomal replication initiation ATPase DnaA|nr:hypothetical protein [Enterovirga sp.]
MRQLVFDLPVAPSFAPDDFLVSGSNETAYGLLENWPDWPDSLLHLRGPRGSGKSHLAAIWAARARARIIPARDVAVETVPELSRAPALVLEDLDEGPLDEDALFHLVNRVRERSGHVLVTSAAGVETCGIATPDLLSRLRRAPSAELGPPDDALLRAVLVKLFLDRQLVVDTSVIEFVANRIERSLARAAELVADLDREALSRGRRVTRPVAAEILSRQAPVGEEDP